MLNIHIWTRCDTFHCKQAMCVLLTQVRYKPYATVERTDCSNVLVFDNLVWIKNYWMWTSIWHTKTMLNVSFKFMYLLMRLLMLVPPQHLLPLYWSPRKANRTSECISTTVLVVPKQYQFKKYKNCFLLMQLHLMLKIFVCDAWLALWIFFEKFCSKIFGTTLQN